MRRGILQRLLGAKEYTFDVDGKRYTVITMPINKPFCRRLPTTKNPVCILKGEGFQVESDTPEYLEEFTIKDVLQWLWYCFTHFDEEEELKRARKAEAILKAHKEELKKARQDRHIVQQT